VVREVDVRHAPPQHLPRPGQVDRLVEVDRGHAHEHGPRDERDRLEDQEPLERPGHAGTLFESRPMREAGPGARGAWP
jgi:hypothetical protein